MSDLEKLLALGAQVVGGDVIWKHKVLGRLRNGVFDITEDGLAAAQVEDVEFKEVAARPARKKATKAVEPVEQTESTDIQSDVDDLLDDLG